MKKYSTIFNYSSNFILSVLFFILSGITFISAQEFEIKQQDSDKKEIITSKETSKKLILADKYKRSNPTKFKQLIFELEQTKLTTEQQHYLSLLHSYHLTFIGEYNSAERKLKKILASKASSLIKFRANYALIFIYMPQKNWLAGLESLAKHIKLLPTIDNVEHYQSGSLTTVIFYNNIGQYELAINYIKKLAHQDLTDKHSCLLKQLTLEAKFNLNELTPADDLIGDALEACEHAKFDIATNIVIILKAKLYLNDKSPDKALKTLLPQIENAYDTHYPMLISEINNVLAKTYWQINDIENAKFYASEALAINKNMTNLLQGVDTYYLLYQIAKKQQDTALALDYFEKYAEADKVNLEGEKAKHLAFQLAEHQAFEQESQIKLLNKRNTLLTTEKALAKAKIANTQLLITILTVALALISLWGWRLWRTHKRVKELAEYDALTGIYNRGHFTHIAESALKYCASAQQELCLIMFDLDHFKSVNDNFGHACGDWVLKETTKICQNIGRKNDIFARIGGEEFCLVLPSCSIDKAMLRAEACRAAIEELVTEKSGCDFTVTASFGVTDIKRSGFNLDKLLADADFATYQSKNSGRNRVTKFEPPKAEQSDNLTNLDNSWNITS